MRNAPSLSANDPIFAEIAAMKPMIEGGRAAEVLPRLQALARDHGDIADAWSMLGFALRHVGRFADSRAAYDRALAAEPDHRGAHEYLGELLLAIGDLAGAEAILARFELLCPRGCEERDDLARAIDAHRARR